jgi:hypothetical protein
VKGRKKPKDRNSREKVQKAQKNKPQILSESFQQFRFDLSVSYNAVCFEMAVLFFAFFAAGHLRLRAVRLSLFTDHRSTRV